jgi:DNA mismatch repair protein MutL
MNRIRLLSDQVANQIAAGEVVERPASVVKELVENAIDADSCRITVEIHAGGRSLIRVVDDGVGMSRDDALLCLERHATSKIQKAEDLSAIKTMGFRGEALPSIASVSRMSLTTRERESAAPDGTRVIIHGGKLLEVKAAGSPPGTSVEVRQLFFNVPARRKFLRSEETEYTHICHYLTLAALAHPQVAFTFVKDSRSVWQLPSLPVTDTIQSRVAALRERMRALSGSGDQLLAVDFMADLGALLEDPEDASLPGQMPEARSQSTVRVWGLIGQPGVSRATRADQHVFVNRRPVENRAINFALLEGYHTALMKGRYPVCCLFLEIDQAHVDVNIHPAKREVKFHDERAVRQVATQAVRRALLDFHAATESDNQPAAGKAAFIQPPPPMASPPESRPAAEAPSPPNPDLLRWMPPAPALAKPVSDAESIQPKLLLQRTSVQVLPAVEPTALLGQTKPEAAVAPSSTAPSTAVPLLNVPLRLAGVIGKLYLVLESDRGLVLLDQHAAHERILFEQMLNRLEQGAVPAQRLLLPETIELNARDAHFLRENLSTLTRLGVGLNEFGQRTFLLDALPPMVKAQDSRRFVLDVIDDLKAAGHEINSQRLGEHTIAKTVCRHAVKANDVLAGPELERLIEDLRHCAMPYTCPHGRPTMIEMSFRELEKKFGRVQ